MGIEPFGGYPYDGIEAYDVTDVNLEDVISYLHKTNKNPSHYIIEYAQCGLHIVALRKLTKEELNDYKH